MIVKNEDQWVRYSLLSILPYVDTILVTDTGSTDHTVEAIESLASPKIKLTRAVASTPAEVTALRNAQLKATKTPWFWVVDGDEIYPDKTAKEVVAAIKTNAYLGVTVRRYDLLGDLYHRQKESVGSYSLWGQTGHLVLRALNLSKLSALHLEGDYPLEGYYDRRGNAVITQNPNLHYITDTSLFHAMYLRRSSLGSNLAMFNRQKYKVETGLPVPVSPPAVFTRYAPLPWEGTPLAPRSFWYELAAFFLTPIKNLKRAL